MSSSRHCVSTWIVTSSGIMSSSTRRRTKSKSVWLAEGNPTSISLNPMATSVWNIRALRSGSIGSMSAWLPSRRSTAHQRGAAVSLRSGQVRSGSSRGTNAWYFSNGIRRGCAGSGGIRHPPDTPVLAERTHAGSEVVASGHGRTRRIRTDRAVPTRSGRRRGRGGVRPTAATRAVDVALRALRDRQPRRRPTQRDDRELGDRRSRSTRS